MIRISHSYLEFFLFTLWIYMFLEDFDIIIFTFLNKVASSSKFSSKKNWKFENTCIKLILNEQLFTCHTSDVLVDMPLLFYLDVRKE